MKGSMARVGSELPIAITLIVRSQGQQRWNPILRFGVRSTLSHSLCRVGHHLIGFAERGL
jgi:hypothetical protein